MEIKIFLLKLYELYLKYKIKWIRTAIIIIIPFLFASFKVEWLYKFLLSVSNDVDNKIISKFLFYFAESFKDFNIIQFITCIILLIFLWVIKYLETKKNNIRNDFFKQIEKNIDNLDLENAKDNLENLKDDFEYFNDKQKYNYYFYSWKIKENTSFYKDENKISDKSFYQDYIRAYDYYKNNHSLLNKAIWLHNLWNIEESKKITEELIKKWIYDVNIYGFYLILEKDKYENFDDFFKIVKNEYREDDYIKYVLWNICKEKENIIIAFERFYKKDISQINKLIDKISYYRSWSEYLQKKFWLNNISSEWKKEYLELEMFMDSFLQDIIWKKLYLLEKEFFNIKAIINSEIKNDYTKAIQYYDTLLDNNNYWTIKMNKVNTLISSWDNWNKIKAIEILEELTKDLDKYLELEKNNPNKDILYWAHIKLAELYYFDNKKDKSKKILNEYKEKFLANWDKTDIRNFNLSYIQSEENKEEAEKYLTKLLNEDNCIIYNLLAYQFFGEIKYIEEAYTLYKAWSKEYFNYLFQLAEIFLYELKNENKYFEIINNELKDLSKERYFRNYIIVWIKLWKVKEIEEKLESYKNFIWWKEDVIYIRFKSYLEEKKWNIIGALKIIDEYDKKEEYIELLNLKSYLQYKIWDESYKETLKLIYKLWKENNFLNFSDEDKKFFVDSYLIIDIDETIKICYNFLQEDTNNKKYLIELKRIYFKLFFNKWNSFPIPEEVTEETIVELKNKNNWDIFHILLDWHKKYSDYWFKKWDSEYNLLIWKKQGDIILNLFWKNLWIDEEYEIVEINNKYIYLHHNNLKKPEELNVIKMKVTNENWETDISGMFHFLDKKWKKDTELKKYIDDNFTNKWLLSFWVLEHFYWASYISLYKQNDFDLLKSDTIFKLNEWEEIKNIVVDVSSIISIFELWLNEIIKDNFNLFIGQSTFEFFNNELNNIILNPNLKSDFSIISDWEWNYTKINYEKDYKEKEKEYLEKIINWLKECCKIESSDLLVWEKEWLEDFFWKEFIDSLLICKDKWHFLYSDDLVLRKYARNNENNIKAFWSETLLEYLSYKKIFSRKTDKYDFVVKLIKLNFYWLIIDTHIIYYFLIKDDIDSLKLVISFVKNKYDDFNFIVSSLIYSILTIHWFRTTIWNYQGFFKEEYKKVCFNKLYNIILEFYAEKEVKEKYFEIIENIEDENDKLFLKSIIL